jgi:hypothetical protein
MHRCHGISTDINRDATRAITKMKATITQRFVIQGCEVDAESDCRFCFFWIKLADSGEWRARYVRHWYEKVGLRGCVRACVCVLCVVCCVLCVVCLCKVPQTGVLLHFHFFSNSPTPAVQTGAPPHLPFTQLLRPCINYIYKARQG